MGQILLRWVKLMGQKYISIKMPSAYKYVFSPCIVSVNFSEGYQSPERRRDLNDDFFRWQNKKWGNKRDVTLAFNMAIISSLN